MRYYKSLVDGSAVLICDFCKEHQAYDVNAIDIETIISLGTGRGVCSVCGVTDTIVGKHTGRKASDDPKVSVSVSINKSIRDRLIAAAKECGLGLSEYILSAINKEEIVSTLEEVEHEVTNPTLKTRLLSLIDKQKRRIL